MRVYVCQVLFCMAHIFLLKPRNSPSEVGIVDTDLQMKKQAQKG